ncbi:Cationic amino acid transporter 4 [Nymphon striatum]|nr:Cationic amino acid transporter 4 [Nymphon striatum]
MSNCCQEYIRTVRSAIFRRKEIGSKDDVLRTKLRRCLNTFDVIFIGLGHTLGTCTYVVTGQIARDIAGPAAIISFLIAGFVGVNIGLCYAEFSSRIPLAGSAYVYTYITIGEIWAFLVGWNVILENVIIIGTAGITWSNYFDSMFGGYIANKTEELTGTIENPVLSSSPNIFAICILIFFMFLLVCGMKSSVMLINVFTVLTLISITVVVVIGVYNANIDNWSRSSNGGFMPYGIVRRFEWRRRSNFWAILTLILPYDELSDKACIVDAFTRLNYPWVKWIVSIGALTATTTVVIGSIYACSRAAYAMAINGMLPAKFGQVTKTSMTPVFSIIFFGLMGSIFAGFFKLGFLIELLSIGCLFAFSIVSASLIILRYTPSYKIVLPAMCETSESESSSKYSEDSRHDLLGEDDMGASSMRELQDVLEGTGRLKFRFICLNLTWPFNLEPGVLVSVNVVNITLSIVLIAVLMRLTSWNESHLIQTVIALLIVYFGFNFLCICMHQQNPEKNYFKIPLVPLVPTISLCLNILLMVTLQGATWIRFAVWIILGLALYFGYGIRHTSSSQQLEQTTASSRLVIH